MPGALQELSPRFLYLGILGSLCVLFVAAMLAENPLGRAGTADEVARVVLFAVSDLAAWVTGTTLVVDAGRLAR